MAERGVTLNSKPKGTLSAYEPSLRDKLAWFLSDMVGGDRGTTNYINQKVRGAADFIPGVGDAVGVDDTKRSFNAGNYGEAAFNAVTTGLGAIPGGGDLAAAGLKGGAGMLGMFIGPMAKNWNKAAADKAVDMLAKGAPSDEVWRETGTMVGKDGKLRQEISDDAATFNTEKLEQLWEDDRWGTGDKTVTVGSLLSHPELYKAYPDLKRIHVGDNDAPGAEFFRGENEPDFMRFAAEGDEALPTMLHEMQHAIQHREGFDVGSNPDVVAQMLSELPQGILREEVEKIKATVSPEEFRSNPKYYIQLAKENTIYETYLRNAGETEARATVARRQLTPGMRINSVPKFDRDPLQQWVNP